MQVVHFRHLLQRFEAPTRELKAKHDFCSSPTIRLSRVDRLLSS
jgi:hypothetical protein